MLWVGLEAFDQILVTQSPVLAQVIRKSLEVVVMFTKTSSVHENQFEGMISLTTVCQEKKNQSIKQTNKQKKKPKAKQNKGHRTLNYKVPPVTLSVKITPPQIEFGQKRKLAPPHNV